MEQDYPDAIEYWRFKCPDDSNFYVCENAWFEFFGCCASDPCADGSGICPYLDKQPLSYDTNMHDLLLEQKCLDRLSFNFYACTPADASSFVGCCSKSPCGDGCYGYDLGLAGVFEKSFLYPRGSSSTKPSSSKIAWEPISTSLYSPFVSSTYNKTSTRNVALIEPRAMVGMCVAVLVAAILCLGIIGKYWKFTPTKTELHAPTYYPITSQENVDSSDGLRDGITQTSTGRDIANLASGWKLRNLTLSKATAFILWTWDVILTLTPMCFIALAIAVVELDGEKKSDYGRKILELTRLGPSLYPILFAAVVGRFYKNLARWRLEQPGGISLAVLEQIFGSQSFATAMERIFVVRTHVLLSILIFVTWALSPLGGQSSSRILSFGNGTEVSNGTVSYLHPAYQVSSYSTYRSLLRTRGSVTALYSSCLSSSLGQKRSPRDMWELPKIPQWKPDKKVGETYSVDQQALANGDEFYASLLGTKLRGVDRLKGTISYNFTVQTSYIDLQCSLAHDVSNVYDEILNNTIMTYIARRSSVSDNVVIENPCPWSEWKDLENPPPLQLLYYIDWERIDDRGLGKETWSVINCTMETIWVETEIHCGPTPSPTSCSAYQQRRVKGDTPSNRLPKLMTKLSGALKIAVAAWSEASGDSMVRKPSATENYFMDETNPYAREDFRNWTEIDREMIPNKVSRRLTTAFNTFWDATLNPIGHTNMTFATPDENSTMYKETFDGQPFMNTTIGTMTVTQEVYRANQVWLAFLLTTTLFLQILAILGLVLEFLITGPDVLGYASSLTRDNPYVPFSSTGSGLDGPERARALRDLRLQLADVRPDEDTGYLAVRAISVKTVDENTEQGSTEKLNGDRVTEQALSRKLDPKRRYR